MEEWGNSPRRWPLTEVSHTSATGPRRATIAEDKREGTVGVCWLERPREMLREAVRPDPTGIAVLTDPINSPETSRSLRNERQASQLEFLALQLPAFEIEATPADPTSHPDETVFLNTLYEI